MKLVKNLRGHLVVRHKGIARKAVSALALAMVMCMVVVGTAFASTPTMLSGSPAIDESVFTVVVNGAKAVLGLFTEFPINVFLALGIMGSAIVLVKTLKH